jgi:hypothetical protein
MVIAIDESFNGSSAKHSDLKGSAKHSDLKGSAKHSDLKGSAKHSDLKGSGTTPISFQSILAPGLILDQRQDEPTNGGDVGGCGDAMENEFVFHIPKAKRNKAQCAARVIHNMCLNIRGRDMIIDP